MQLTQRSAFLAIGSFIIIIINAAVVKPHDSCSRWVAWTACSSSCGPGVRFRRCIDGPRDELTLTVKACQSSPCPSNTQNRFMLFTSPYKSWSAASDDCKGRGGWLATINSAADQQVVEGLVRKIECPIPCRFIQVWIGGKHDGTWKWVHDNLPINSGYTNWHHAFGDRIQNNMSCLSFQPYSFSNGFGKWYRYVCSYLRPYVCELAVTVNP